MKKFERLTPQQRRQEIQEAALALFHEKGFAATTMENIVQRVTLSKGGVYRIYPSTTAILSDLILAGMHLRNAYYEARVQQELAAGRKPELAFFVEMIGDSLLLYPEFSKVYVEFLWEKQRNPQLSQLYQQICQVTVQETEALIRRYDAQLILPPQTLLRLTELMNSAILSLHVLGLQELFSAEKDRICQAITQLLTPENEIEKENYHA